MKPADDTRSMHAFLIASLAALLVGCGGSGGGGSNAPQPGVQRYVYQPPAAIGDGWQVADGRTQNVDTALLEQLMDQIRQENVGFRYIDSVLVAKDGQLIFSEQIRQSLDFTDDYGPNRDVDMHAVFSVSKSFASTLIGIAIDQGRIPGVEVPIHDYFSNKFPIANWGDDKARITLQDWLTMRHGYAWDEWSSSYFDPQNVNAQMSVSPDPIQFLLDRPMASEPGEVFAYSTGVSFGLGQLLESATGESVTSFMEAYLFAPLNIERYHYWTIGGQTQYIQMGAGLYLSTRDMAKLGQLFLDRGMWNGVRVVSEAWVDEATAVQVPEHGYGYQWWIRTFRVGANDYGAFTANGLGGQHIYVFPALNVVAAVTGSAYEAEQQAQRDLIRVLEEFILPAVL